MGSRLKSLFIIVFLTVATLSTSAHANIIRDSGFELNDGSWTTGGFSSITFVNGLGNVWQTGCLGHDCVSTLNAGAYMDQILNTTVGMYYNLSFYVMENSGAPSEISIFWDGNLVYDLLNPANNVNNTPGNLITITGLLATSSLTDLQIHGRQDPGLLFIDNVNVSADEQPVPEPATIFLVGAGLSGIGLLRKKLKG